MHQWISTPTPRPGAAVRLYCLAYAGGAASVFHHWGRGLPSSIEVCALEFPGRGRRIAETSFVRAQEAAAALSEALEDHVDRPFAVFGHSMGGMVAYEALLMLQSRNLVPRVFFPSAVPAPRLPSDDPPTYHLPQDELVEELKRLNGTPPEVLERPDVLELLLPIVRADFELCQTYEPSTDPPLQCRVVALGGRQDSEVSPEQVEAWDRQTVRPFSSVMLEGDHFFLNSQTEALLKILQEQLAADSAAGHSQDGR